MAGFRIGIVGCGGIAHAHIEGYRAVLGDLGEVVAGCDLRRETLDGFCDRYGLALRFTDARALIRSGEVDAIALLTPPAVRDDVIFPAIEQGIHLLVEKPFGECLADAIAFANAAEDRGTALAVNHELRFMPDILAMLDALEAGAIGEVRFAAHDQFQNRTRVSGWRAREERLEISIFSIHLLDRMRWLIGLAPESVTAVTRHWNENVRGETFAALRIQFEREVVGTMVSNWHSLRIPESRLRIDGSAGSLLSVKDTSTGDRSTLTLARVDGLTETRSYDLKNALRVTMGESMKRLLEAAQTGTEPPHSGRDGLATMAIVDAAYLSASRGGQQVEIAEVWQSAR